MKHPLFNALMIGVVAIGVSVPMFAQTGNPSLTRLIGPKNFVSPTYRGPAVQPVVREGLTNRETKRLAARAIACGSYDARGVLHRESRAAGRSGRGI
jgi:hypothetical protein